MTHILPPHTDLSIPQHSSISTALAMEQQGGQLSPQDEAHPAPSTSARKRKKNAGDGDEGCVYAVDDDGAAMNLSTLTWRRMPEYCDSQSEQRQLIIR